jgi:sugar O-acyltransferase (sialic acid O-acetyltransferase NeuD family)
MSGISFGLIGAGGFGREVMPFVLSALSETIACRESELKVYFLETGEAKQRVVNGVPLISVSEFLSLSGDKFYNIAIGSGQVRAAIDANIGDSAQLASLIAPDARNLQGNLLGQGVIMCPFSMLTSNATVGKSFQCNIYAYVAHDSIVGNYVTFAPGVHCLGNVIVEDYAYIGAGAIIKQGTSGKPTRIGRGATVGMGAVVTKDVAPGVTVVGNPAKQIQRYPNEVNDRDQTTSAATKN